jgi:hypothetical protein
MTVAPGTLPPGSRTEVCLSALSGWAVAPRLPYRGGVDFLIRSNSATARVRALSSRHRCGGCCCISASALYLV